MKRAYIFIVLLLLCAYPAIAQQFPEIIYFKDTVITVSSERMRPVEGQKATWAIDIKDNAVEKFKLVSGNTGKVDYVFNRECVVYDNNGVHHSKTIPYLTNGRSFYSSSELEIKREALPITITCNEKVIATFVSSVPPRETIKPFKGDTVCAGDSIRLAFADSQGVVKANKWTIHLIAENRSFSVESDAAIPEDLKPGEYKVRVDLTYADGKSEKGIDGGIVIVVEKSDTLLSVLKWILVALAIIIAFALAIVACVRWKKRKKKADEEKTVAEGESPKGKEQETAEPEDVDLKEIEMLKAENDGLRREIGKLQQRLDDAQRITATPVDYSELKALKERLPRMEKKVEELTKENDALRTDSESKKDLRKKIKTLIDRKGKMDRERQRLEKELTAARLDKERLEKRVEEKNEALDGANREKETWKANCSMEAKKASLLQERLSSFSKQTHYVYAIDEALCMADNALKSLFATVNDANLMKRLAQPVVSGTSGLDSGIEAYLADWRNAVYDNQEGFFGKQVMDMKDDEVKDKLITDFLEPLALRDSFGKLVRLYLMTNVGWINELMVKAGFDVDAIQTLFALFKNLFTLFGVELSYPHLFVDTFDDSLHTDNRRCEIFNYFVPSEELRERLRSRECESLIVDVTRIGIPSSKTASRRKPMVSLPN